MCRCILCIVSRLIKIYGEYIYEQAAERSQNSCFVYERGDSVFCEKEDGKEKQSSFLTLFMKVDRHFMAKCFGQMQELGIYPGQIPVLGLVATEGWLKPEGACEDPEYQTADCQRFCTTTGKGRLPL